MNLERGENIKKITKTKIQMGGYCDALKQERKLVSPLPVRQNTIRVRRVSMLAPSAAAFTELPTRLTVENAEM